jgi:hypothetical protein
MKLSKSSQLCYDQRVLAPVRAGLGLFLPADVHERQKRNRGSLLNSEGKIAPLGLTITGELCSNGDSEGTHSDVPIESLAIISSMEGGRIVLQD